MGTDIDFLMLHAKTRPTRISQKVREKDESIRANLLQYGCEQFYIDVLVSDFSNSIWNKNITFDSIITDRKCFWIFFYDHRVSYTLEIFNVGLHRK